MLALIFVLMQYLISAKAGLVNYVDGQANVAIVQHIPGVSMKLFSFLRWKISGGIK